MDIPKNVNKPADFSIIIHSLRMRFTACGGSAVHFIWNPLKRYSVALHDGHMIIIVHMTIAGVTIAGVSWRLEPN